MSIWINTPDIEQLNARMQSGLSRHLGVRVKSYDAQSLSTVMAISGDIRQPEGLLAGGASAALAEITAGIAGGHCIDSSQRVVVGQELNISHLRSARDGHVTATAHPLRLGRRSQVWHIEIHGDDGQSVAVSRVTNTVLERGRSPT